MPPRRPRRLQLLATSLGVALVAALGLAWLTRPEAPAPTPTTSPAPAARPSDAPAPSTLAATRAPAEQPPPPSPTTASLRALDRLAEAGGFGRIACGVPDGSTPMAAPALIRAELAGATLHALVRDEHGSARLLAADGAGGHTDVGLLRWEEAWPGTTRPCWVEPAPEVVEHTLYVVDRGLRIDSAEALHLDVTGCEGVGAPYDDGSFDVRARAGVRCLLRALDRRTGRRGELWVDADAPSELALELTSEDPTLAGIGQRRLRQRRAAAQLESSADWLAVIDAAREAATDDAERAVLDAQRDELLATMEQLRLLAGDEAR